MPTWHNRLGEGGQRLTILSLLPRAGLASGTREPSGALSLREAVEEIFRIGGEDGEARAVLSVTVQGEGETEFTTEENVTLRELAARLYGTFGVDGEAPSFLEVLSPDDDLLDGAGGTGADGGGEGPLGALRRLREAVYRMFGGSAEEGIRPTVLSLLVGPDERTRRPDGSAAA